MPDPIYSRHTYSLSDMADALPAPLLELLRAAGSQLPPRLATWLGELALRRKPIELHAMVLAVFASFVAPFGERRRRQWQQRSAGRAAAHAVRSRQHACGRAHACANERRERTLKLQDRRPCVRPDTCLRATAQAASLAAASSAHSR